MTYQILSGQFNPHGRVMLVSLKDGSRMILEKGLKWWGDFCGERTYCTAKRHNGPIFNGQGVCTSGHQLIAVNYVGGEA